MKKNRIQRYCGAALAMLVSSAVYGQEIKSNNGKQGKPLKVYLMAGQSNMSGGGDVVADIAIDAAVGDKVRIWDASDGWGKQGNSGKWVSLNQLQAMKRE